MKSDSRLVLRLGDAVLGALLLYAAIMKGRSPQAAELGVDRLIGGHGIGKWAVLAVIVVECVVGVALLVRGGFTPRFVALLMLVGFTAYLAALKWGAPGTACGCTGSTGVPGTLEFSRNTCLIVGASALVVASARHTDQPEGVQS